MGRRRRLARGGLLATIGYILSPLSWWNDLFVNIPIAYGAASLVALVYPEAFAYSFAAFYLLTNILGFILMHRGAEDIAGRSLGRRSTLYYIVISAAYTALVLLLAYIGVLPPLQKLVAR